MEQWKAPLRWRLETNKHAHRWRGTIWQKKARKTYAHGESIKNTHTVNSMNGSCNWRKIGWNGDEGRSCWGRGGLNLWGKRKKKKRQQSKYAGIVQADPMLRGRLSEQLNCSKSKGRNPKPHYSMALQGKKISVLNESFDPWMDGLCFLFFVFCFVLFSLFVCLLVVCLPGRIFFKVRQIHPRLRFFIKWGSVRPH